MLAIDERSGDKTYSTLTSGQQMCVQTFTATHSKVVKIPKEKVKSPSWWRYTKCQRVTKIRRIHYLGTVDIYQILCHSVGVEILEVWKHW